jgi:hypothetical protein
MQKRRYWATVPENELGNELGNTLRDYYQSYCASTHYNVVRSLYLAYYGFTPDAAMKLSSNVHFSGRKGEVVLTSLNKFRSLVSHVTTLVTAQRPAFKPIALDKTVSTREATEKAKSALEFDMQTLGGESELYRAAERANALTMGGVFVKWDPRQGPVSMVDEQTGKAYKTGQNSYHALGPLDVPRQVGVHWTKSQWLAARLFENKYDLAARFGLTEQQADEMPTTGEMFDEGERQALQDARDEAMRVAEDIARHAGDVTIAHRLAFEIDDASGFLEEEQVPVFYWFHRECDSLPDGREAIYISDHLIFDVGPMRYPKMPIAIMTPHEMIDTSNGYSSGCDALAPQRIMDSILSGIVTRHDALQMGCLLLDQSFANWEQIPDGPKVVKGNMTAGSSGMRYEQLFRMDPGELGLYQQFAQGQRDIVGVPEAMTGNLPGKESLSGKALALLKMSALEYHASGQGTWHNMCKDVGTIAISNYQTFAQGTFEGVVVQDDGQGASNAKRVKFSAEELSAVQDVAVEVVNPLFNSPTGRQAFADEIKDAVPLSTYIEFVRTGNLDVVLDPISKKERVAQQARELLSRGEVPIVLPTDKPGFFIEAAIEVLDDLDARKDPAVFKAVMEYIARQGENTLPESTSAQVYAMIQRAKAIQGGAMPQDAAGVDAPARGPAKSAPELPADPVSGQVPSGPPVAMPS